MKSYKVTREVQKCNSKPTSAADIYITTENGTLKDGLTIEEGKKYLKELRKRAFQSNKFEKVTDCGCRQFRAHTANSIWIYSIK